MMRASESVTIEPGRAGRTVFRSLALAAALVLTGLSVAGCGNGGEVLGAVFGLEGAPVKPYRQGTIAEPRVLPGDDVIGSAANNPGQCIYRRAPGQRFRAACPDGFDL